MQKLTLFGLRTGEMINNTTWTSTAKAILEYLQPLLGKMDVAKSIQILETVKIISESPLLDEEIDAIIEKLKDKNSPYDIDELFANCIWWITKHELFNCKNALNQD